MTKGISKMKSLRPVLVLLAGILFLFVVDGTPFIFSDAYCYYHTAKSLVTRGSFNTLGAPEYLGSAPACVLPHEAKYVTIVPPGTAILESPFLLLALPFDCGTVYTDYFQAFNGHSLADGLAVLLAGIAYGSAGVLFAYHALRKLKYPRWISVASVLLMWIASYAYAYMFEYPGFPHMYELFAASGLLYFIVSLSDINKRRQHNSNILWAGVFAGLLVLVRPTDLVIVIPLLIYALLASSRKLPVLMTFVLAGVPFALILFVYNYVSYGGILDSGYTEFSDLGPAHIYLWEVLFSPIRGWFIYSPLVVLSMCGLFVLCKKNKKMILLTVAPVVLIVLVYSLWPAWWAGHSIGQRFFIVLVPFVALGLGEFLQRIQDMKVMVRKAMYAMCLILAGYSLALLLLMRLTPMQKLYTIIPGVQEYHGVAASASTTPLHIVEYHVHIMKEAGSFHEYIELLRSGFQGGRSILLLLMHQTEPIMKVERIDEGVYTLHIIQDGREKKQIPDTTVKIVHEGWIHTLVLRGLVAGRNRQVIVDCHGDETCTSDWGGTELLSSVPVEEEVLNGIELTSGEGVHIEY